MTSPFTSAGILLPDAQERTPLYEESAGGILLPAGTLKRRGKPKGVDLFAGIGGFSLGFIQAGYEVVCAVENDAFAALTYLTNLGQYPMRIHFPRPEDEERFNKALEREYGLDKKGRKNPTVKGSVPVCGKHRPIGQTPVRSFIFGDARDVTGDMIRYVCGEDEIDCVMGGPPCHGFSIAGKMDVHDERSPLVFEFARLIVELIPRSFCFENVPNIVNMTTPAGVPVLDQFMQIIRDGGYDAYRAAEHLRLAGGDTTANIHKVDMAGLKKPSPRRKRKAPEKPSLPLFDAANV